MASRTEDMTGAWVEIGTGVVAWSPVEGGSCAWQVQASGASDETLSENLGHPVTAGETLTWDAGAEAVFLKGSVGVKVMVTVRA